MPKDKCLTKLTNKATKAIGKKMERLFTITILLSLKYVASFVISLSLTHTVHYKNICFPHSSAQYSLLLFSCPLYNQ